MSSSCRSPGGAAAVFAAQRFGTEKIGKAFGPVMILWFAALAAIGIYNIVDAPRCEGLQPVVRSASSWSTAGTASSSSARWCWR
jgi:hypothetical protein